MAKIPDYFDVDIGGVSLKEQWQMGAAAATGLARLATTATTRLAAAERSNPGAFRKAIDYVKRATGGAVADVPQIAAYASGARQSLAVAVRGMVRAGIDPDTIFPQPMIDEMRDKQLAQFMAEMRAEFSKSYGAIDNASVIKGGRVDSALTQAIANVNAVEARFHLPWGSDEDIRRLHVQLRMFLATDEAMLEEVLLTRRVSAGRRGF